MALPSVDEAFGVAYVEALACGVPAIGCEGEGGPEEIVTFGEGMLLVPPREPDALAEAIRALLADEARLTELSESAQGTAAEEFSWERCGRATVRAYERALEEGPR
jgi:teichuronic acid biosynthesis glycosyltransferase TuaC